MKYINFFALILSPFIFGQIGINKSNINPNSTFETGATKQGVMFPRIPTIKTLTDVSFLATPSAITDGLLVYNEGKVSTGNTDVGSGFYYWENNKWNYLVDFKNIINRLNVNELYSINSYNSTPTIINNFVSNSISSIPSILYKEISTTTTNSKYWQELTGTTLNFQVKKPSNIIQIFANGNGQTGSETTVTSQQSRVLAFSAGIFLKVPGSANYELYAVGTFVSSERVSCLILPFSINSTLKDLPIGDYSAKIFIFGRRNNYTNSSGSLIEYNTNSKLTFGSHSTASGSQNNTSCYNTDNNSMKASLNVIVNNIN